MEFPAGPMEEGGSIQKMLRNTTQTSNIDTNNDHM